MQEDLQKIHQASMYLLEKCGIKIIHPEILALAKKHGIKVNGEVVFFTEDQLMHWVKKAPSTFSLYARNPEYNITFGGDRVEYGPGYGAPSMAEKNGTCRPALIKDYVNFIKLYQQSPYHNINGGVVVQPNDITQAKSRPIMAYLTIIHSDKCLMAGTGDLNEARTIMEMTALAFDGKAEMITKPRIGTIVNMNSPLIIDRNMLENMMIFAEYGQPVIIASCAMAGSTGPITLASTIALSNAEILSGIAVSQMIREGTPIFYGNQTTAADMKTGSIAIGSTEGAICYETTARLAKAYGLPCRGGGAITDATTISVQSGYESMMTLMATAQAKTNLIIHSAGILSSYNSMSYEKLAVDLEMIGMVKKFINGLIVTNEMLALDVIEEIGIGGHFLGHEHTMNNCRTEPFNPEISLRGRIVGDPNDTLKENMNHKIENMLAQYEKPSISKKLDKTLTEFLTSKGYDPSPYQK